MIISNIIIIISIYDICNKCGALPLSLSHSFCLCFCHKIIKNDQTMLVYGNIKISM